MNDTPLSRPLSENEYLAMRARRWEEQLREKEEGKKRVEKLLEEARKWREEQGLKNDTNTCYGL